jgi:hypothetical protein
MCPSRRIPSRAQSGEALLFFGREAAEGAKMKRANGPRYVGALLGAGSVLVSGAAHAQAPAQPAPQPANPVEAITMGSPILEMNVRAAFIEQAGIARDAEALTVRTRLGWRTAPFHGFSALVEIEDVSPVIGKYNSTTNGKAIYPVEADPDGTELNRVQLSWTNGQGETVTAGRQRIILDDSRFVGNVGWRQDEQTFDAVRADATLGPVAVTYAYLWDINRVFAEAADWDSDSHLLNVAWTVSPMLKLTGFVYALDLTQAPAQSTVTYGLRASGSGTAQGLRWSYVASYAVQEDYEINPLSFSLDYRMVEGGLGKGPFTAALGYEALEGNGAAGFSTPLATLHAFQGWADVFLVTPATGIEDKYASLRFTPSWTAGSVKNVALVAVYHDYEAELGGADLGSEWNVQLSAALLPRITGLIKFADYDGPAGGPADRQKVWVGLSFTL